MELKLTMINKCKVKDLDKINNNLPLKIPQLRIAVTKAWLPLTKSSKILGLNLQHTNIINSLCIQWFLLKLIKI